MKNNYKHTKNIKIRTNKYGNFDIYIKNNGNRTNIYVNEKNPDEQQFGINLNNSALRKIDKRTEERMQKMYRKIRKL